jgi:hypothetical protein
VLKAELGTRFFLGFALALSRSWWKLFALFFWLKISRICVRAFALLDFSLS